jgi:CHAD domain-containing protein
MTKDEALQMCLEYIETDAHERKYVRHAIKAALEAKDEPNYKKALEVWLDKTEWVQETVKPHELGMHRADVLKQRIEEASPQRTWVGLTDEDEIDWEEGGNLKDLVKAIEAKLKDKNT